LQITVCPMRKFACTSLRFVANVAWIGVVASFLIYNFYIQMQGLREPPCAAQDIAILWRSTHYCATATQARLWELNYDLIQVLLVAAVVLTAMAGACRKYVQHDTQRS
jgi:hypothetical protein